MSKLAPALVAAAIVVTSLPAFAMDMKMMDTNGDGMISKDEFMKYHESMYDGMKKNSNGMVSTKDLQMMISRDHMTGSKGMNGDHMMKDENMMKDKGK